MVADSRLMPFRRRLVFIRPNWNLLRVVFSLLNPRVSAAVIRSVPAHNIAPLAGSGIKTLQFRWQIKSCILPNPQKIQPRQMTA